MKAAHPLTAKVPKTSPADYAVLRHGIKTKGQIHPIVIKDELIWDGRNRQAICQELGLEAIYQEYTGPLTAGEYILQANLRRNLTPDQRDAMIVALAKDVVPQMRAEASEAKKNGQLRGAAAPKKASHTNAGEASDRTGETQKRFRKLVGHARKADQAIAVIKHEDLAAKVEKGELSLRAAGKEAVVRNKAKRRERPKGTKETRFQRMERLQQMLDKNKKPLIGLTRQQVDPDFKGSSMEWVDKYGHVQIMTKAELEADLRVAALMAWIETLNDLRVPLEKYLAVGPFELTELEAYIKRSPETRLRKLNTMVGLLTRARDSLEPVLGLLNKLTQP